MNRYRVVWTAASGFLALVGTARAFTWSPGTVLPVLLAFLLVGAVATLLVALLHGRTGLGLVSSVVVGACTWGAAAVAFIGFALFLGAGVWLLALGVLITSPYVIGTCVRWIGSAPTPSTTQLQAAVTALAYASPGFVPIDPLLDLRLLTDDQLQRRWSDSWREPSAARTGAQQLHAAWERQDLLDEMERRNPEGFVAWLFSHDQAFGGLPPRLDQAHAASCPIDWDALLHDQD